MTQRVFDVNNEQDMKDLWDILPELVKSIEKDEYETEEKNSYNRYMASGYCLGGCPYINIKWNDKTEIRRPIQEANESDIGKLCKFWSDGTKEDIFGKLTEIDNKASNYKYRMSGDDCLWFEHCRRLTKQEIEGLF